MQQKSVYVGLFCGKKIIHVYVCVLDCAAYLKVSFVCVCIFKMDTFC